MTRLVRCVWAPHLQNHRHQIIEEEEDYLAVYFPQLSYWQSVCGFIHARLCCTVGLNIYNSSKTERERAIPACSSGSAQSSLQTVRYSRAHASVSPERFS